MMHGIPRAEAAALYLTVLCIAVALVFLCTGPVRVGWAAIIVGWVAVAYAVWSQNRRIQRRQRGDG